MCLDHKVCAFCILCSRTRRGSILTSSNERHGERLGGGLPLVMIPRLNKNLSFEKMGCFNPIKKMLLNRDRKYRLYRSVQQAMTVERWDTVKPWNVKRKLNKPVGGGNTLKQEIRQKIAPHRYKARKSKLGIEKMLVATLDQREKQAVNGQPMILENISSRRYERVQETVIDPKNWDKPTDKKSPTDPKKSIKKPYEI